MFDWFVTARFALSCVVSETVAGAGLDLKQLIITNGKTCWYIFVDALVLNDDGNVLDALSIASLAALKSTRIPKVKVSQGASEDGPELELDDDPDSAVQLDTATVPVIVSVSQVRRCWRCWSAAVCLRSDDCSDGCLRCLGGGDICFQEARKWHECQLVLGMLVADKRHCI